jgi:hypothetical protein
MDEMKISYGEHAKDAMERRGIREEDIEDVLTTAEETKVYLYEKDGDRFLAKKRIGNFTVYVEYKKADGFLVQDTYSHRVLMAEDINA